MNTAFLGPKRYFKNNSVSLGIQRFQGQIKSFKKGRIRVRGGINLGLVKIITDEIKFLEIRIIRRRVSFIYAKRINNSTKFQKIPKIRI